MNFWLLLLVNSYILLHYIYTYMYSQFECKGFYKGIQSDCTRSNQKMLKRIIHTCTLILDYHSNTKKDKNLTRFSCTLRCNMDHIGVSVYEGQKQSKCMERSLTHYI